MGRVALWPRREAFENEEGLMNTSASAVGDGDEDEAKEHWVWYDANNVDIKCLPEAGYEQCRAERTARAGDPKRETRRPRNNLVDWPIQATVSAPLPSPRI